jgi:hypothetical protein
MIFMLFLAILIPLLAGLILTWLLFPAQRLDAATGLLHLSLAAGIGLGIASCLYFAVMLPAHAGALVYLDRALVIILIALGILLYQKGFLRREGGLRPAENVPLKYRLIFPVLFGGTLISGLISIAIAFLKEPHGKWDAWVIWNLHARFILRGGEHWQNFLSSGLDWTHPDYPLLIPLSIVRMWKYAGSETLYGPIILSVFFTLAVAGLLVFSLAILRSRSQGYLAGLVLMGSPYFLDMGAYQFADIPLAFFFLATFVAFFLHDRFSGRQDYPLMLAGLTAALAAWTKNEGLLFLLCVPPARFAWVVRDIGLRRALRQAAWFVAGALPVLMVIAVFKLHLAPSSDIFSGQGLQPLLERLMDGPRYGQILSAYVRTALTFTQGIIDIREGFRFNPGAAGIVVLGLYMTLMGIRTQGQDRPAWRTAVTVSILMLAGYFGVYLITPHDLRWHLLTSLNRLFIQLWPAAIFLCFMVARTPEQALVRGVIREMDRLLSRRGGSSEPNKTVSEPKSEPKKGGAGKQKRRRT